MSLRNSKETKEARSEADKEDVVRDAPCWCHPCWFRVRMGSLLGWLGDSAQISSAIGSRGSMLLVTLHTFPPYIHSFSYLVASF